MTQNSESLNQNEAKDNVTANAAAKKSLVAFLRSIKFKKPRVAPGTVEKEFAQLHPRTPAPEADSRWVPSAN